MIERCDKCGCVLGWTYWRNHGKTYCSLDCDALDNHDWKQYEKKEEDETA